MAILPAFIFIILCIAGIYPSFARRQDEGWGEGDVQGGLTAGLFRTFNDSREPERVLPGDPEACIGEDSTR